MPILHRKVVPNVPAWTADNGKIVFRAGKPSHRAEMRATAAISGSITLDSPLTSLGFPAAVTIASASDAACYRYDDYAHEELWGDYGDIEGAHVADEPGGYAYKFHAHFGYDYSHFALGNLPAVFPDMEHMPDRPDTFVCVRSGWRFCHDWDAGKAFAMWHAWPMEADSFYDSRWPANWEYGPNVGNPFQDPGRNVIIGVFQTWSYEDEFHHTVNDYVLVGGAACGANSARSDVFLDDAEVWPTNGLRIGARRDLYFGGVQDLYNLANIDLEITLAAAYA